MRNLHGRLSTGETSFQLRITTNIHSNGNWVPFLALHYTFVQAQNTLEPIGSVSAASSKQ